MNAQKEFGLKDLVVSHNSDHAEHWIDVDLHDDSTPVADSTFVGRVVLTLDEAELHANRILDVVENAREAVASALANVKYWHENDCRETPLKPATHWLAQVDHRWVAVADEDHIGWFGDIGDFSEQFILDFMVKDINDVPTSGTLSYSTGEGTLVEEPAK